MNSLKKNTNKIIGDIPLLSKGATLEGRVVARDRSSLFVDLGLYGTGVILGKEFYIAKDIIKNLKIGDPVVVKVLELENEDGYRELSLKDASREMSWQKLQELKEKGEIITVKIIGVNKGGLLTSVENIPAFIPVSQLAPEHYPRVEDADKQKILKELQKFMGQTLEVKILDLNSEENKLILSERARVEGIIKELLQKFQKGDVVEGEITGIANFGAFIKFPAEEKEESQKLEGLIHISELDWQLVENPAEIVKVGQKVKAKIIEINDQVFLSLKALKPNPWEEIEKKFKKGDIVKGRVIKFSPFGAFVEVAPKIRGLCHISEFSSKQEMESKLEIGKEYNFQILLLEPKEYRMSLRLVKIASKE